MRHLTELLERGAVTEERRGQYYAVLSRETERLHRLVEGLLDFGRMEAGRAPYRFEPLDAGGLVSDLVDEFSREVSSNNHRIEIQAASRAINADRAAISLALRNLLDNAVKYSADSSTVSVSVETRGHLTGISVEDHGVGITEQEQREVFRKFVRGSAAQTLERQGNRYRPVDGGPDRESARRTSRARERSRAREPLHDLAAG